MIKGIYEQPIIVALQQYFNSKGFATYPHAHLNIAWENILSDVDLLITCGNEVIAIEVKSKRDIFKRAFIQLSRLAPFVDRMFIATDNQVLANRFRKIKMKTGIIYIDLGQDNDIMVKKIANRYRIYPTVESLCYLKKCCLQELAKEFKVTPYQSKQYIALDIYHTAKPLLLRSRLKEIVTYKKHKHPH